MIELRGNQGKTMVVEGSNVKIIKKATWFSSKREKTFAIRNITSVEVKEPGRVFVGFIQLSIGGGKALDSSYTFSGGAIDAVKDENSVIFKDKASYEMALKIKEYIESYSV
jgi:hypothetical protein